MAEPIPEADTTPRSRPERALAWAVLDDLYRQDQADPRVAGARAAAEWTEGHSIVAPVTNRRQPPTLAAVRWESHAAAMRELDIGVGQGVTTIAVRTFRRRYARGASEWLFWWTGLEGLPSWLVRAVPLDPEAS